MDSFLSFISVNVENIHWIFFCLLLLAGLNIPISEDLILLTGGALAAIYIPDHTWRMYLWIYFGCLLSGWMTYWIGRLLGPKLYEWRFFKSIITKERTAWLEAIYNKMGIYTFFIGRFIPGGARNALFMSSGLVKMPFYLFILRDSTALILSSSVLFGIGYFFGNNLDLILHYFRLYSLVTGGMLFSLLMAGIFYYWIYRKRNRPIQKDD